MQQPDFDPAKEAPQGVPPEQPLFEKKGRGAFPSFAQWRVFYDKQFPITWLLLFLWLFGALTVAKIAAGGYFFWGIEPVFGDVLLVPIFLLNLLSAVGFGLKVRRESRKRRIAYDVAFLLHQKGDTVRVFADRAESVGVTTETVYFANAALWEWRHMLVLTDGKARVDFYANDYTPDEAYQLCCALYGKTTKHYGSEQFCGARVPTAVTDENGVVTMVPPAPLPTPPAPEQPQLVIRLMPSGKLARKERRRRWNEAECMFLPLLLLPLFTIAMVIAEPFYYVYILGALILSVCVLWSVCELCATIFAKKPQKPVTLRLYSDRLVAEGEGLKETFPAALFRMQIDEQGLFVNSPLVKFTLPLSYIEEVEGMEAFLTPAGENSNADSVPVGEDKEQE